MSRRPMRSFHHQDDQQNIIKTSNKDQYRINGTRPTPLHVHKNSHLIHKTSTTSSSSISTAFSSTTLISDPHNQRNRPVNIIYTHSPKVIHTEPRDFMALVQKLTGISSVKQIHQHVNESSTVSDEADVDIGRGCGVAQDLNMQEDYGLTTTSDSFDSNNDRRILSEIPLFTPSTTERLDHMFRSPQMMTHQQQFRRFPGDSIFSPATLEFLKPLPEC